MRAEPYIKQGHYPGSWSGCLVKVPGFRARLFPYSKHADALAVAVRFRDACIEAAGGWQQFPARVGGSTHAKYATPNARAQRNNALGILGVHLFERWRGNVRERTVIAQLILPRPVGGQLLKARFSVRKYGLRGAIALARRARAEFEAERDRLLARHNNKVAKRAGRSPVSLRGGR